MASLKDNFDFINTERINLSAEEISGHKKKSFLHLSFDDGFKNNLLAAAVLKKYGIPAVFFITTDIINRDFKRLPSVFRRYIKDEELMDWDDVRRLGDMGFEIGSHSLSHNPSSELSSGDSSREFSESKRIIEEETGLPVKSFSFPFGRRRHFSDSDLENIYLAGYKYVFSTELNNCQHDFKGDNINCFGRIGFEPYLSPESINILLNGFLRYFR
jgi:peptidoglycan/xylan/chitin deacetylase (PgdA/CDA1 family)